MGNIIEVMKFMGPLLLVNLLVLGLAVGGEEISFRKLPAGDSIQVSFRSSGCFHQTAYEFDFQGGKDPAARVTAIEEKWDPKSRRQLPEGRKELGAVVLSDSDLAGLDRLLKFYRQPQPGGCTTIDHITVSQRRGGKVAATESFTDSTCATYDRKDLTLFTALARRLEPKTP